MRDRDDDGEAERPDEAPETLDPELKDHLGGALGRVMEALEADAEELEDLSDRLFGVRPEIGLEEAALDHAKRTHDAGALEPAPTAPDGPPVQIPGGGGKLEEFVRLAFKNVRGEVTDGEARELAALEAELAGQGTGRADGTADVSQPEVDPAEFIRAWRRENPQAAGPDPALTDSGEIALDPLAGDDEDGSEERS